MEKQINIFADDVEKEAVNQFYQAMTLPCNVAGALMPDVHTGYTLPIGSVIKSKGKVFPSYVGYDIGCGVGSIKIDLLSKELDKKALETIQDEILKQIPVGINRHAIAQKWENYKNGTNIAKDAFLNGGCKQLGTLGGGNHFLEVGKDEDNYIWITVHSGSRGFGYKIAEKYMELSAIENTEEERYAKEFEEKNKWRKYNPEKWEEAKKQFIYRRVRARLKTNLEGHYGLYINSTLGQNYIKDMNIALDFALENRKIMLQKAKMAIEKVLNTKIKELLFVNRNHNHAELIDNEYIIHRKGATHADKNLLGVIPGNMRDGCFIVKGKGYAPALNSSSHGAGRVLSRKKAKDTLNYSNLKNEMSAIVNNITEATLDEAPEAYKNIFEVMDAQKEMVDILYHIRPILNIKG